MSVDDETESTDADELLTNDPAEYVRRRLAQQEAELLARLDAALADAARIGKEPFDLDRFEAAWDTSTDLGWVPPRADRERRWMRSYYLDVPDALSLDAFVEALEALAWP